MPGDVSLQKHQYYGHQRNAFWPIMSSLFNQGIELKEYKLRTLLLVENKVAVWDVLQSCYRSGSLDSAIRMDSIKVNDFYRFFLTHKDIAKVCFNGAKAEAIYLKFVLPDVKEKFSYLQYVRLPSTSPAHAAITLKDKTLAWQKEIKNGVDKHEDSEGKGC